MLNDEYKLNGMSWIDFQEYEKDVYLKDAMESVAEAEVHHLHHRSLWHRWEARLEQEAQPSQLSDQQVVQQFPEVATSLAMLSR